MGDELIDQEQTEKCCLNCKFFEERTGFCRFNPPCPTMTSSKGNQYLTAVYPKISFPKIDWCHKFEHKE